MNALLRPFRRAMAGRPAFPAFALAAALLLPGAPAWAHKASDAYLRLQAEGRVLHGRLDIALRDLDRDLDLDQDADDALTWREVRTRWPDIAALALRDVHVAADGAPCEPAAPPGADGAPALTTHSDGRYAVLRFDWTCAAAPARLDVDYRLFARTDPTHRGILRLMGEDPDRPLRTAVLVPGDGPRGFVLPAPVAGAVAAEAASSAFPEGLATAARAAADGSRAHRVAAGGGATTAAPPATATATTDAGTDDGPTSFPGFVSAGIHHILVGYDHVLFLLSLLLPAVWVRQPAAGRGPAWRPADDWRPALWSVLRVVTAFTVAHSITLALAVFDVVDPPSRWVESLIAASVVAAALNNLWPVVREGRWKLTFVFGLVHGFGFASALKDSGLARGALVAPLLGFNVGVELGQLAIVAACLPLAWAMRGTRGYRGVFAGGSCAIALVATLWLVQRAFDLQLIAG